MLKTLVLGAAFLVIASAADAQPAAGRDVIIRGCVKLGPQKNCALLRDWKTGLTYDVSGALPKPTRKPRVVNVVGTVTSIIGDCQRGTVLLPATLTMTNTFCPPGRR